jgi:transcriptional regulator with XRE-family HTH domain
MKVRQVSPALIADPWRLGERLRSIRIELYGKRGLTALAQAIGVSDHALASYEAGSAAPAEVLLAFVEHTRADPNWLLHGEGPRFRGEAGESDPAARQARQVDVANFTASVRFPADIVVAAREFSPNDQHARSAHQAAPIRGGPNSCGNTTSTVASRRAGDVPGPHRQPDEPEAHTIATRDRSASESEPEAILAEMEECRAENRRLREEIRTLHQAGQALERAAKSELASVRKDLQSNRDELDDCRSAAAKLAADFARWQDEHRSVHAIEERMHALRQHLSEVERRESEFRAESRLSSRISRRWRRLGRRI